jgi:hypothetical protein
VILALAVAASFLWPAAAEAGCGKHVHVAGEPSAPAEPKAPCHGPSCSQAPDSTPLLPPSVPTQQVQQDPAIGPAVTPPGLSSTGHRCRTTPTHAIHRTSPPEPPPRSLPA